MRFFVWYLRRRMWAIASALLTAAVFAAIFALYELPAEPLAYALALSAFFGLAFFSGDYTMLLLRHRRLERLKDSVIYSLDLSGEETCGLDGDYEQLLYILKREAERIDSRARAERRDAIDYYTLWAHQIKTPIAAMRLLLQSENVNREEFSAELLYIEQYVEMVLSYLNLDNGGSDYLFRSCELDTVIRTAVRRYAKIFILRKISLDYSGTGLTVTTDEKWLGFVIGQVLSNALKYTPPGGRIRIYSQRGVLCIADSGIGIRAEDLPRVFENGFTGYNGREDKKSTGIGLYLSKRICTNLGHDISISSIPGGGTTVRLDMSAYRGIIE